MSLYNGRTSECNVKISKKTPVFLIWGKFYKTGFRESVQNWSCAAVTAAAHFRALAVSAQSSPKAWRKC